MEHQMTRFKALASLALAGLFSVSVMAENGGAEKLNQFVDKVQTFEAHFEQTVIDTEGNILEEAEGQFQLQRPGKFRWDYQTPYPQ
jgi:outer membrane lipoprotein carrier protein